MTIARARTAVCIVLAGLVASAVSVARASAATPAQRYPVGSAGMSLAVSIAERYWDADPCGGDVALSWATVDPSWVNARAYWSNPIGVSGHADANFACSVVFNANAWLPWPRFCSVVAHEYGHLTGHSHSDDPSDVMAGVIRTTLPACAAVADPAAMGRARSRMGTGSRRAPTRAGNPVTRGSTNRTRR